MNGLIVIIRSREITDFLYFDTLSGPLSEGSILFMQAQLPSNLTGLSEQQVAEAQSRHGQNSMEDLHGETWWSTILHLFREPMILILVAISVIYFILGDLAEAYFMLFAILAVSGISFYQDNRNRLALKALKILVAPNSKVIRQGAQQKISTIDIVPGDLMLVEEGDIINADSRIVYSHDFSVNESTLTGEAFPQSKSISDAIFSGTLVSSGMAVAEVSEIGKQTRLGKLGKSLVDIKESASPLQIQITRFVRNMSLVGILFFLAICVVHFINTRNIIDSLLRGLTLAMSILPEEIPVAFVTFMALGSRRLLRQGILVKHAQTVEALGNTTVICADKTGTLTENKMELVALYDWKLDLLKDDLSDMRDYPAQLIETAMWASEPFPFDPMEKALHDIYEKIAEADKRPLYNMVHEYPLAGVPPMMTHVFENDSGEKIISAKGAPEAFLDISELSAAEQELLKSKIHLLASQGLRLLGVGKARDSHKILPELQQQIKFEFLGMVAFLDPPKKNIQHVFEQFEEAGIRLKIITGDNDVTTSAIARAAGIKGADEVINGQDIMLKENAALTETVKTKTIFTRMFPEAKLKVIEELKRQGDIVAMLGDGVNDGPALKSAHIGVAMGKKGTEVAKNAADLVLLEDDLSKLIDAIANGRRIYANLKKAIQYIISIHIPIILTVTLPLVLGWIYPVIFTPVHVIFLELIMGPTCSIVYENDPADKGTMQQAPRPVTYSFLSWRELSKSIVQGLIISAGVLGMYQLAVFMKLEEDEVRTATFLTLVFSNMVLTLVNRTTSGSFIDSLKARNRMINVILLLTASCVLLMMVVPAVRDFFHLALIPPKIFGMLLLISFASVLWIEIWKWLQRSKHKQQKNAQVPG